MDKIKCVFEIFFGELDEFGGELKIFGDIENDFMEFFDYEYNKFVNEFVYNKDKVYWLICFVCVEVVEEWVIIEREMVLEGF